MPIAALPVALLASSAIGAGGAIASGVIGSKGAKSAADKQISAQEQALQQQQANEQPYLDLGKKSIGDLMTSLSNGTFGAGSLPTFAAPTAADAEATPGYQFTRDQGQQAIERGAAAAGGAFTGGTLKALDSFTTGLADSTYGDTFNRAMAAYQAHLAKQSQEFQQTLAPVQIGQAAAANQSANIGTAMTNIGNAGAAGTVGSANAITSSIGSGTNNILQSILLGSLFKPTSTALPVDPGAADALKGFASSTTSGISNAGLNLAGGVAG